METGLHLVCVPRVKLVSGSAQWGHVCVSDAITGQVVREYEISVEDANATRDSGVAPPGCTEQEWLGGASVVVTHRPLREFEAMVNKDGTMALNYGIDRSPQRVIAKVAVLQPEEFAVLEGVISIRRSLARRLGV